MSEPGFQSSAINAADAGATSVIPVPAQDGGIPTTPAIEAASTQAPLEPAISQPALTSAQPGAWTELADTTTLDAAAATSSPQWAAPSSSTAYTTWQTPSTTAPTTYSTPETASSSIPASSIPASLTSASLTSASSTFASSTFASSTFASSTSDSSSSATAAAATATSTTNSSSAASTSTKWLPGVIVGSIAFVAILAGLAFWLIRRRRQNKQKYHAADQCDQGGAALASPDMFGYRRPLMSIGMSQTDAERAEQERRELIRKSMISRSSWSASQFDYQAEHQYSSPSQVDITATGAYTSNNDSAGLRDDYKEWDAQIQQQKALLAAQHPSQAEVSHVELPASRAVSREISRERLRLDTRNISPLPASLQQEEAFPVSPVSAMSVLPPVPTRSHKRPPSTDFTDATQSTQPATQYNNATESPAGVLSRRQTNQSTRSRKSTRSIARNPHTRHLTENNNEPESPSSLYSVDLQDGRQNRAWANYHHDDAV